MTTLPTDPLPPASTRTILGHPVGLFLLFFVEMWERFSYYGMRGLLLLYLIAVFSPHELPSGMYTNDLEITQLVQVEKPGEPGKMVDVDAASRVQRLHVAVDQPNFVAPPGGISEPAGFPLRITRTRKTDDSANEGRSVWVPTTDDAGAPVVVKGSRGVRFSDDEFGFQINNPTDQPVTIRVGLVRSADNASPPLFRVNNKPTAFTAKIAPDSTLTGDAKPFQIVLDTNRVSSGRFWTQSKGSTLYGWYTGLAYLFPILGGIIADKLIGTHRSMILGGVLISIGHIVLGVSGMGELAHNATGMSLFIMGLAIIVLGTGHFKPTVTVMVGQLYPAGDPRRDAGFTIFYMGINLGAFICAFVCGTLGEKVGWHWGFASAAAGMLLGLGMYVLGRPLYLRGIGEAPRPNASSKTFMLLLVALGLSALFGWLFHTGALGRGYGQSVEFLTQTAAGRVVGLGFVALVVIGAIMFVFAQRPGDKGPTATIFIFMFFNAFFWIAFEQAGSSINIFTEQNTDRFIGSFEVPATWFQSVNAAMIFMLAPLFAAIWTGLGRRGRNPSQPVKIALGLIFLGVGYLFMVYAGRIAVGNAAKASMMLIIATYFWHTVGELCLSPTGLSYVTKAAPVRFVSLLMGIWYISSFMANLGGGLIAGEVEKIDKGEIKLPWNFGGQADYFFLFVVSSCAAGLLILLLTPLLKRMMRSTAD